MALHEICLLGMPLDLQARADEQSAELMRELSLIAVSDDVTLARTPRRVLEFVQRVETRFGGYSDTARQQIQEARAAGAATADVTFELPQEAAAAAEGMLLHLDEADEFCRSGDLLTLAATDELVRFRRWSLGEIIAQVRGAAPVAWQDRPEGAGTG